MAELRTCNTGQLDRKPNQQITQQSNLATFVQDWDNNPTSRRVTRTSNLNETRYKDKKGEATEINEKILTLSIGDSNLRFIYPESNHKEHTAVLEIVSGTQTTELSLPPNTEAIELGRLRCLMLPVNPETSSPSLDQSGMPTAQPFQEDKEEDPKKARLFKEKYCTRYHNAISAVIEVLAKVRVEPGKQDKYNAAIQAMRDDFATERKEHFGSVGISISYQYGKPMDGQYGPHIVQ